MHRRRQWMRPVTSKARHEQVEVDLVVRHEIHGYALQHLPYRAEPAVVVVQPNSVEL